MLVGGDTARLARFGRPVIDDRFPGEGPAGGVLTAIDAVPAADRVVVAACDLPHLDASTVVAVAGALDDVRRDAAVAVTDRWQLSLTAWRSAAASTLTAAFAAGGRSLHDLVRAVPHVEVAVAADALRNVNRPADLAAAQQVAG